MKVATMVLTALLAVATSGCSRNRQEAVIKANEADKAVALNVEGAITNYEQATILDPTNHRIFFKLAMAYRKKEDWEKVASTLSRATQLAPSYANYWFERGYAIEQQAKKKALPGEARTLDKWEEAKEPLQKCIETDPNFADCYEELGNAFLYTDDEQKALDNYTKAIEHNPNEIRYYAALADLYVRLSLMKDAEQVLKEAKTFAKPGEKALFGIHVLLSQVYQDRNASVDMVTELEQAKAVASPDGPESVQILFSLGSTYAQLQPPRTQEAISMLKGFNTRACKGSKAMSFKTECETASTLVQRLGGSVQ